MLFDMTVIIPPQPTVHYSYLRQDYIRPRWPIICKWASNSASNFVMFAKTAKSYYNFRLPVWYSPLICKQMSRIASNVSIFLDLCYLQTWTVWYISAHNVDMALLNGLQVSSIFSACLFKLVTAGRLESRITSLDRNGINEIGSEQLWKKKKGMHVTRSKRF
jgi:hypothetical protein